MDAAARRLRSITVALQTPNEQPLQVTAAAAAAAAAAGRGGGAATVGPAAVQASGTDSSPLLQRSEPGRDANVNWELLTDSPGWQARDSQGEVAFDGKLWLLGGWYESFAAPPRDVWSSSTGVSWDKVTGAAGWKHSDFPMTAVFQDRMVIMGGWTNGRLPDHSASNEVWCSDDGASWQQLTHSAGWSKRLAAGITVFQDKLWILGGTEDYYFGDASSLKNDVWCTSDGVEWECVSESAPWAPRGYLRAVTLGDRMFVLGGGSYVFDGDEPGNPTGYIAHNDVWSSTDGQHWEEATSSAPWHPRIWFSSVAWRDRLWVIGGWSSEGLPGSDDQAIVPVDAPNVQRSTGYSLSADAGRNWNWGDVWYSEDGKEWYSWSQEAIVRARTTCTQNQLVLQTSSRAVVCYVRFVPNSLRPPCVCVCT